MDQVYNGNYTSYQPSYNCQASSSSQWASHGYNQESVNDRAYYTGNNVTGTPYESYSRNTYSAPCMGHCNPPKLYADTYSYLSENLMKPVIEEVYQDLKSITATNTIANNSAATKMGLKTQDKPADPQGQGVRQNQTPNQAILDAVPLSAGHIKGQLHNISAMRPGNQAQSMPFDQNTPLRNRVATPGYMQPNAGTSRNGIQV